MGVEVDDRDPSPTDVSGDAGHVGQGDRVIAPEHDGDDAGPGDLGHSLLEATQRLFGVARGHLHVPEVDDGELDQRVDPERQARAHPVVGQIVGDAHRLGAEATPRSM